MRGAQNAQIRKFASIAASEVGTGCAGAASDQELSATAARTAAGAAPAKYQNRPDEIAAAIMSAPQDPPPGWETPKYRATRDIHPSPNRRHRLETPFASCSDNDAWQYGEQPLKAGEEIETREWPHPSFQPLNYSARKVLEFFNMRQKSRMQRSPWRGDRLVLDDGLSGPTQPNVSNNSGVTAA